MSKLCLGTYLTVLNKCKLKSCTQKHFVGTLMHIFSDDFDETDDSLVSNIVAGRKNPPNYVVASASECAKTDYSSLVGQFENNVVPLIDQNKKDLLIESLCVIIESDNDIDNECQIDVIGKTTKATVREKKFENNEFLTGLLIYLLKANNNSNSEKYVKELTDKFFNRTYKSIKKPRISSNNTRVSTEDDSIYQKAQEFCINYENEMDLLPLCQIATFVDPLHKYVRSMYTDFCKCSKPVRKKILALKKCPSLTFSQKDWIGKSLALFDELIREKELCTVQFLYDGAKYFHRAYRYYSDYNVDYNRAAFKRLIKLNSKLISQKTYCTLGTFIDEYLELKANKSKRKLIPPIDVVWAYCSQGATPEYEVTYWVSMTIIAACCRLYDENGVSVTEKSNSISSISLNDGVHLISTQEDMYLYALLNLHMLFCSRID